MTLPPYGYDGDEDEDDDNNTTESLLKESSVDDYDDEEEEGDIESPKLLLESKITFAGLRKEAGLILALAMPLAATRLLIGITRTMSVFFIGRLTSAESLAGATLANSVATVTGFTVMMSFVQGLNTMAGQAYGAKDYASVGYNFQMALLLSLAIAIFPVSAVWAASKPLLVFLGQEPNVASRASLYLQVLIPSILMFSIRQCVQAWCQVQRIVKPFTVNAIISTVISVPMTYVCVKKYDFVGGALATTILNLVQAGMDVGYVYVSGVYKKTWYGFSISKALKSLRPMVKLAFSSQLMIAEWWASEITVLMAGQLSNEVSKNEIYLSAFAIFQTLNFLPTMIFWAMLSSVTTRVSNELGSGNASLARRVGICGILLSFGFGLIVSTLLLTFREGVGALFVKEEAIVDLVQTLVWPLSIFLLASSLSMSFEGVISGSGRQAYGAVVVVISYFIFGLPVSYIFGFRLGYGVIGLVFGRVFGKLIHMISYGCIYWMTKWDEQVDRANKLVDMINANNDTDCQLVDKNDVSDYDYDEEQDEEHDLEMEPLDEDANHPLSPLKSTQRIEAHE